MRTANLCLSCKGGRNLCGNSPCPLLSKFKIEPKINSELSKDFFGPATSVFVGHHGYPNVNVGPLAAIELKDDIENPSAWYGKTYNEIVELRSLLLRSKVSHNVKTRDKFIIENQEIALAKNPTEVEMSFVKRPIYKVSFSDIHQPMGPTAELEKLKLTENPKIPHKIEYIVTDDLKANEASLKLYDQNLDVYKITTILSSGALGFQKNQKLVPTRWSFVAVYDMIAKALMENIRNYPTINQIIVAESQFLDNHFIVLMLPGSWEFENFETWSPGSFWSQDLKQAETVEEYEPFQGRKAYADKQGGGFYASRLGCCEGLNNLKRQARVVVFREIYEGYCVPVGSWQILENVRNAFRQQILNFSTLDEAFAYIRPRLRLPLEEYIKRSKILQQRRLSDFL